MISEEGSSVDLIALQANAIFGNDVASLSLEIALQRLSCIESKKKIEQLLKCHHDAHLDAGKGDRWWSDLTSHLYASSSHPPNSLSQISYCCM